MNSLKIYLLGIFAIAAAGFVMAMSIQRPTRANKPMQEQRFYVRGEIRDIDAELRQIRIKHEEIPNYMAAMTMPFDVRDTALLRNLKTGDQVGFELVVTKEDSWIASIQKLSEANDATAGDASQPAAREIARVQIGQVVPNFTIVDQNHRNVSLTDFRGQVVLVTFIYTRCPLPNFCPLMSKNFASLQERFEKEFPGKFRLLSVSIDPEFDQPDVLKTYGSKYSKNDDSWTFGSSRNPSGDSPCDLFGLIQERSGGLINHDLRTALIGPDGRLIHIWKSNVWTPYEVQRRVEELFANNSGR
jgi:protein SCO1/2